MAYRPPDEALPDLLVRLREGHPLKRACALVGVSYETVLDRRDKARAGHPGFADFATAIGLAAGLGKHLRPPGRPSGRRPKAIGTTERAVLIDRIRDGASYAVACRAAGITLETFVSWLRLGGHPRPPTPYRRIDPAFVAEPYASFVRDVVEAETAGAAQTRQATTVRPDAG